MFENKLRNFLQLYECDTELFEYFLECKNALKNNEFVDPIKIETSIKTYDNGVETKGRYLISVTSEEFKKYTYEQQQKIFTLVFMDINKFKEQLSHKKFQLYFGIDNKKGKVYFGAKNIICYESSGKIKYYNFVKTGWIDVFTSEDINNLSSIYKLIDEENVLHWYGIGRDDITKYFRPKIHINNETYNTLSDNEKKEFKILSMWHDVTCPCCAKNKGVNNGEKYNTKEEIIKNARLRLN